LVAASVFAAVGGAYDWSVLPSLVAAAALFVMSGARVAADPLTRRLDLGILAGLGIIAAQIVPLPPAVIAALSPAAPALQDAYALEPVQGWRTLSIYPAATRTAFAIALSGAFMFWASRDAFGRGGIRPALRVLGWVGIAGSVVALAQQATAPRTVYWRWHVADPRALPFGPFIDRNHFATWLVLAISVIGGYLAARVIGHMRERGTGGWRPAMLAVLHGDATGLLACLAMMILTLAATLSRSGGVALVTATAVGAMLVRSNRRHTFTMAGAVILLLATAAAWTNGEGFLQRLQGTLGTPTPIGRLAIWRDTVPIVNDFPVIGTGAGTFAHAMFVYQRTGRQVLFNHAHNEYLQLISEGGVALLATILAIMVMMSRIVITRVDNDSGPHRLIRIGAAAGLAGIAVQSIWDTGLHEPANLLLAAVLAGLAVRQNRSHVRAAEPQPS
jgi:O-antigen ligase